MAEDTASVTTLAEAMGKLAPRVTLDSQAPDLERLRRSQLVRSLAVQLGQRYWPDRVKLSEFKVYHANQKAVVERLKQLTTSIGSLVSEGSGVIFYGPVGTGKDHLLASMLYEAAREGHECRWINGQELYGTIRDNMDSNAKESKFVSELYSPKVLAISDPIPPVGDPSAWNVSQLYRILDRRYRSMKSTWVSLNALSEEDADAKLSAPVFDRLRENAAVFPCFWPSFRERKR